MIQEQLIFDPLRKKNVAATPEEIVRQHFIKYLNEKRGWPIGLMKSEVEITIDKIKGSKFRCDIVGYNSNSKPLLIVECKANNIKISKKTFEQIWKYAIILKVRWIVVTNGDKTFAYEWKEENGGKYQFINDIPFYERKK